MISIIYPYRNLELLRLEKSLNSLRDQTINKFEVILVDYGSDSSYTNMVSNLVSKYSFVKYYYSYTQNQIWSRAKALNIGIKKANFDILFTADVDMIFKPELLCYLQNLDCRNTIFCFKVAYLKKAFSFDKFPIERYNIDSYSSTGAQGILLFSKEKSIKICGYDEFMHGWGSEDNDFLNRMRLSNLNYQYVDTLFVYHQWHSKFGSLNDRNLTKKLSVMNVQGFNSLRYERNKEKKIIAINKNWGKLIEESDFLKLSKPQKEIFIDNKIASIDFLLNELVSFKDEIIKVVIIDNKAIKTSFVKGFKNILFKNQRKDRIFYDFKEVNDKLLKEMIFNRILNYSLIIDFEKKAMELIFEKNFK